MWYVLGGLVVLILGYGLINGARNSDPLNRKCAAAICEYLTTRDEVSPIDIQEIFKENARYRRQANHVASMVPVLLMRVGYPKDAVMQIHQMVVIAAEMQPK